MLWRTAGATVTGSSHIADGSEGQDRFHIATCGNRLVAVVADGAGSARYASEGATIAIGTLTEAFSEAILRKDCPLDECSLRALVAKSILAARSEASEAAKRIGATLAEFNSTIMGILTDASGGLLFHIGDGAAAVVDIAGCAVISPPENGQFTSETFFYTEEEWLEHLRMTAFVAPSSVLLATDGAACFAFDDGYQRLCGKFFEPLGRALKVASNGDDFLTGLLTRDDAVTASDDDKTLVWATLEP